MGVTSGEMEGDTEKEPGVGVRVAYQWWGVRVVFEDPDPE